MEDTLRVRATSRRTSKNGSLNPCFNGRYSTSIKNLINSLQKMCLNPCFNGRYSTSVDFMWDKYTVKHVLILILMEDTLRVFNWSPKDWRGKSLNPYFNGRYSTSAMPIPQHSSHCCLNPYFNGRYSTRFPGTIMEIGLRS